MGFFLLDSEKHTSLYQLNNLLKPNKTISYNF